MNSKLRNICTSAALSLLTAWILVTAGCASPDNSGGGGTPAPKVAAVVSAAQPVGDITGVDVLRRGDRVTVNFSGSTDSLPKHEERIKEDGTINLPLIGDVMAAGVTRRDLEVIIHKKYVPQYFKTLTVTVAPEERFFYLDGQIRSPGRHSFLGDLTLMRAIAAAGDFTDFANRKKVEITRNNGKKIVVNCLKAQSDSKLDIPIFPDDRIYVPRRLF